MMDFLTFLLLSLSICPVLLMPPPAVEGLNLQEGDIMEAKSRLQRSVILGDQFRWNGYIPYVLNETLDLNWKGVISRAFERLRLKACIDFKPRTTENDYISVESSAGCLSFIGKQGGRQQLFLSRECVSIGYVEHMLLHALGFFHEETRYDRDDYVTINYTNILQGQQNVFDKTSENISTTQGTAYDYMSVMHSESNIFTRNQEPTIMTKDPQFQNVIGKRYDLSPTDTFELNMLYKCKESISFLDHCSFDNDSMCQMNTCSSTDNGWKVLNNVSGGPFSDHSNLPSMAVPPMSKNTTSSGPSSFMHFSTQTGQQGDSGRLMSKRMTPRRDCHVQCLEFFYYHSGNDTDQLNIWIREYQNDTDTVGTLTIMDQITGPPTHHWLLHYVPLNADKAFIVEFEARKGAGDSRGGFSVDDINLSESECPHNVWQIRNFTDTWNEPNVEFTTYSPFYYSPEGYRYQLHLDLTLDLIFVGVRLVSGAYDDQLQWPCAWRQVTFSLLDQNPDIQQRMSFEKSMTTAQTRVWDNPSVFGYLRPEDNYTEYYNPVLPYDKFLQNTFVDREFIKGGDLIFLTSMQDISALKQNNSPSCPKVAAKNFNVSFYQGAQEGSCSARPINVSPATTTTATTTATTTTTTTATTKDSKCWDIFCSGADIVHPTVVLLLTLVLLVVN